MTENDDARQAWEQMLRRMLGEEGAREAMAAMEASGLGPDQLAKMTGSVPNAEQLDAMMNQLQRMIAAVGEGGVNWDVAKDVARQVAHQNGDPSPSAAEASRATAALSVADLWLDAATDLPPAGGSRTAWSRAQWVEGTFEVLQRLTSPVGTSMTDALTDTIAAQGEQLLVPGGQDALRGLAGAVFGMQVGQASGTLAREVFGTSDTGLPLVTDASTALVVKNIEEFAEGLEAEADEVVHLIAVREAAHARLYAHVPWLRHHILGLVEEYARGISIDLERMEEAVRSIDVTDTAALQKALSTGVFALNVSPEQAGALERLETALALVEGWVEDVAGRAVAPHLAHAVPLREMLRRRRAAGGPAEHVFASLVGLQLRPRKLREAAALWGSLVIAGGAQQRDALWQHPDLLPSPEDLNDGAAFLARQAMAQEASADIDAALDAILQGGDSDQAGTPPSP